MADVIFFLRAGWQSLWRQNIIWLFSALPLITQFLPVVQNVQEANFSLLCLAWLYLVALFIFYFASFIGVPYIAYRFLIGNPATFRETLFTIRKLFWRVVGCSCLFTILLLPLILIVLADLINNPAGRVQILTKIHLFFFLPLSIFSAFWQFIIIRFLASDLGIRESIKKSWSLFIKNFGVMALIGLSLAIIYGLFSAISGALTALIQSGLDFKSLSEVNYINPSATQGENQLFMIINGIGQTIFASFNAFVYVSAYLKYSNKKSH